MFMLNALRELCALTSCAKRSSQFSKLIVALCALVTQIFVNHSWKIALNVNTHLKKNQYQLSAIFELVQTPQTFDCVLLLFMSGHPIPLNQFNSI